MEHIRSIHITAFRGIKSLQLNELLPINILTGDNNCGKTSVLEVLESFAAPGDFRSWRTLLRKGSSLTSGGLSYYEGFYDLFDTNQEEKKLEYTIETTEGGKKHVVLYAWEDTEELSEEAHAELGMFVPLKEEEEDAESVLFPVPRLQMEVRENGELISEDCVYEGQRRFLRLSRSDSENIRNIVYISPIQHAEGNVFLSSILADSELYEDMLEILKEYDKDILSINYDWDEKRMSGRGTYKILSKSHKKALPLNVYGDGMKKALLLMSAVVKAKDGILLLDEFETAIHTSAMDKTFRWILETCIKKNVQVFLTSHSREAIDRVLKCSKDLQEKMAVYTLYKDDEKITARRLTGKRAIIAQDDMGLELR